MADELNNKQKILLTVQALRYMTHKNVILGSRILFLIMGKDIKLQEYTIQKVYTCIRYSSKFYQH